MRHTIFIFVVAYVLTVADTHAQTRPSVRAGSLEAARRVERHLERMREIKRSQEKRKLRVEKAREMAIHVFGDDSQWKGKEWHGTFVKKHPNQWIKGDWGQIDALLFVLQKLNDNEFLVEIDSTRATEPILLRGFNTDRVRDGLELATKLPMVVTGTYTYVTAIGITKTILVLEYKPGITDDLARKAVEEIEDKSYRVWTDNSGRHMIKAKLVDYRLSRGIGYVFLVRWKDHRQIRVPLSRLSKKDQKWLRQTLKERKNHESE